MQEEQVVASLVSYCTLSNRLRVKPGGASDVQCKGTRTFAMQINPRGMIVSASSASYKNGLRSIQSKLGKSVKTTLEIARKLVRLYCTELALYCTTRTTRTDLGRVIVPIEVHPKQPPGWGSSVIHKRLVKEGPRQREGVRPPAGRRMHGPVSNGSAGCGGGTRVGGSCGDGDRWSILAEICKTLTALVEQSMAHRVRVCVWGVCGGGARVVAGAASVVIESGRVNRSRFGNVTHLRQTTLQASTPTSM